MYFFHLMHRTMEYNFNCIPESFNKNISHKLFDYKIDLCEFTALEHKFKREFGIQKPV